MAQLMEEAFQLAEQTLANKEVPVGCLLIFNPDQKLKNFPTLKFTSGNTTNENKSAIKHAELVCFEAAAIQCDSLQPKISQEKFFQNCNLYVTVEPCIMCAAAIETLKIRNVFYGCSNERFGGCGSVRNVPELCHEMSSTKYHKNFLESEKRAILLLKTFYASENENAPDEKRLKKHEKRRLKILEELDTG